MLEAYTLSQSYDRLLEEHKALQSQLTEKDAIIERLEKQIEAVNEAIADIPDTSMISYEWQAWLYSTLPFLKEPD